MATVLPSQRRRRGSPGATPTAGTAEDDGFLSSIHEIL
jgi:hypothetical protein